MLFALFPTTILSTLVGEFVLFLVLSSLMLSRADGDVAVAGDVVVAGEAGEGGGLGPTTTGSVSREEREKKRHKMWKEMHE